jgi:hypothetical protein
MNSIVDDPYTRILKKDYTPVAPNKNIYYVFFYRENNNVTLVLKWNQNYDCYYQEGFDNVNIYPSDIKEKYHYDHFETLRVNGLKFISSIHTLDDLSKGYQFKLFDLIIKMLIDQNKLTYDGNTGDLDTLTLSVEDGGVHTKHYPRCDAMSCTHRFLLIQALLLDPDYGHVAFLTHQSKVKPIRPEYMNKLWDIDKLVNQLPIKECFMGEATNPS